MFNYMLPFLFYSILGHFILLTVFIGEWSQLFFKPRLQIENAIRVDIEALPEMRFPAPISGIKKTAVKKKQLVKKKIVQKKLKKRTSRAKSTKLPYTSKDLEKKQRQALDKLKTLQHIDKMREDLKSFHYKGEKISKGQKVDGKVLKNPEDAQYFMAIKNHINLYWNLPQELADENLKAKIYVEVNSEGEVLNWRIVQSSGSEDFDARVMETIQRASPFPKAPTQQLQKNMAAGVVFNFPE